MSTHAPLIIDVAGLVLTQEDCRRLAHPLVGGVILFGRNWRDRVQLTRLCRQIKAVRPDLLIAVDHEGGRVQRFRTDGFTHLPPMAALGALAVRPVQAGQLEGASTLQACNAATATGYVLGAELRACGVDLSFTPVLDLDFGESSVIGDRSFGRDPRIVALLAQALMHGLLQSGMGNCGKHFPGHGFVKADSHLAVPVDRRSLKAILSEDAAPYGWLSASLQAVMPAHVIYPRVDQRPAGFSARWLNDVLRRRLGFTGAIFSDDLSMAAARQMDGRAVSFTTAALAALQAGCDLVLLCNQSVEDGGAPIDEAIDDLSKASLNGDWLPSEASEERRRTLLPRSAAPDWDALMVSERYMQALSLLP
ncbi:MAG: beta-N-acetylhexosaminidase [Hydrogenophaga sp.]|uniref:beta-N-acetylhexosaminidase n=1 Tax=Hydrogenophaga sp. TaxID=1904254 RepID=UPI00262DAB76|nr:beta-N-acetylhexosaminidase [Hydrogenophaga sp.]MDM7941516.1 beta-N-acetylhexosaminidase [Hydrogenophaga sp.]